jgi:8-oxo-dGTP pyrophosphatase MutT (NUDIX family)
MASRLPGPDEAFNAGPPSTPRQAASVIVLRDTGGAPEILLVRRTPHARFMAGVWVFPGGSVQHTDGSGDGAYGAAALRELAEEAGVTIADPASLIPFSRWITPEEVKVRFDTHFYLASMPPGQEPVVDGEEIVDHAWFTAVDALAAHEAGQILLVFPTIRHLEQLAPFASVTDLMAHARGRTVVPVQPRVVIGDSLHGGGEVARIVLPGEPGYD